MERYRNAMEVVVETAYNDIKNSLNCCHCDKCREDIIAYTLNKLPPKYVVSVQGELYAKAATLTAQYRITILSKLAEGARIVRENPKHDEETS